jgi:hypothetical protein
VPVVEITAKRFAFSPDKVTLKKGRTVKLRLHSEDVTHGFFLRALARSRPTATAQLHWIIQNGIFPSGMPRFEAYFSRRGNLATGALSPPFAAQGKPGEPAVYGGETSAARCCGREGEMTSLKSTVRFFREN